MQKYATIRKFVDEVRAKHAKIRAEQELSEKLSMHFDKEGKEGDILDAEVALCTNREAAEKYEQISRLSKLLADAYRQTRGHLDIDYTEKVMEKYKKRSVFQKIVDFFS
jgi:hypothetical protein